MKVFKILRARSAHAQAGSFKISSEHALGPHGAYTVSLNLARFDRQGWLTRDETMDRIADALDHIRKVPVLTPRMARRLLPVDPLALKAGLLGSNPEGLFKL